MSWEDIVKKRNLYIRRNLPKYTKMFLKDLEEHLDNIIVIIKQEFDNYPEYDREKIEKVVLYTLEQTIDGIKMNLKVDQSLLETGD